MPPTFLVSMRMPPGIQRRLPDRVQYLRSFGVTLGLTLSLLACRSSAPPPPSGIALNNGNVEISGLSSSALGALADISENDWPRVFRVAVSAEGPAMLGTYSVDDAVVRFTPAFPLDAGRAYEVRFDPAALGVAGTVVAPLAATIGRPAEHTEPTTVVAHIYPSGNAIPENILRMYVEFSGPMGRKSGVEYLKLLDHGGKEIPGAVLPLDYEFWSPDHTRFTVFFDPGRVKDGILPNREMGRAFTPGQTVTLVVSKEWRDEHGLPLKNEHRRTFTVLPADSRPLDPKSWRITPPASGGRDPLVVTFPTPLDRSLLLRALGVRQGSSTIDGDTTISGGETEWQFVPREPWRSGSYQFLALDILEDVAGNQVGRAFEVDNFDSVDKDPNPEQVLIPFQVK